MTRPVGAVALVGMLLAVLGVPMTPGQPVQAAPAERPNVVVILTDDMRLDDLRYMPYTRRLFARKGTTFQHVLSPHPLCCPARAQLLTGQYGQNSGVLHNGGPWGGYKALSDREQTLPQWFLEAGYRTAYVGKFLNGYTGGEIPGLTVNDAMVDDVYAPWGHTSWNDGQPVQRSGHQTDWIARRTGQLVHELAPEPFFIWAGYVAPHGMIVDGAWGPPVPPRRFDEFRFAWHRRPQSFDSPAYNERNVKDKPELIRRLPAVPDRMVRSFHRGRVLSLYAVDEGVRRTVSALQEAGVYEDTIIVFTSDNGLLLGEHRARRKNLPYQESVRVPYLMTGPGVPEGVVSSNLGTLVDVPLTVSQLAGVTPTRTQDGVNLLDAPPSRAVLVQAGATDAPWSWRGVYTKRYTVAWHTNGDTELYDRSADPYELRSVHRRDDYRARLAALRALFTSRLEDCAGAECLARAP